MLGNRMRAFKSEGGLIKSIFVKFWRIEGLTVKISVDVN
jgi:hypothetical protein